jgi:hypothetical protein
MEWIPDPLLIIFLLRKEGSSLRLRCRGCRDLRPAGRLEASHIKGQIELDGREVPVVDASDAVYGAPTEFGPNSCIIVIEHNNGVEALRTGVLVRDIEEVMRLAAHDYPSDSNSADTLNLRLLEKLSEDSGAGRLLTGLRGAAGARMPREPRSPSPERANVRPAP